MLRLFAVFVLAAFAQIAEAQVDREDVREFSDMMKDALGEVDSTSYPVLKLYPVAISDRSWYNAQRQGIPF